MFLLGCEGAPLLPFLYIASNILFNISILNLLKVSNAIVASLAGRAAGLILFSLSLIELNNTDDSFY